MIFDDFDDFESESVDIEANEGGDDDDGNADDDGDEMDVDEMDVDDWSSSLPSGSERENEGKDSDLLWGSSSSLSALLKDLGDDFSDLDFDIDMLLDDDIDVDQIVDSALHSATEEDAPPKRAEPVTATVEPVEAELIKNADLAIIEKIEKSKDLWISV